MTETSKASSLSASGMDSGLLTFAMSTLTPCCNIGVITMKMINSTSITSTMGVTLMLEFTLTPSFRFANAISSHLLGGLLLPPEPRTILSVSCFESGAGPFARRPISNSEVVALPYSNAAVKLKSLGAAHSPALQEVVDQFARRVIHLHVERFHASGQVVEHHHGRDGHEQPDGGGHQRFRDTARDRCQTGSFFGLNTFKRVDDADHCAQQSDERGRRSDGCQTAQSALQLGMDDRFRTLQSALGGFDSLARNLSALLVSAEFHQARGHHFRQMALLVALRYFDGFFDLAIAQRASHSRCEGTRLLASRAEGHGSINHYPDRPTGHDEQNDDHCLRWNTHLVPQRNRVPTHRLLLEDPGRHGGYMRESKCCYIEHELLSSSELVRLQNYCVLQILRSVSRLKSSLRPA